VEKAALNSFISTR